ncbi:MAG TPA: LysM peptidoglycan-binding domain-containing protein [Phototrophicaceae bacterium]|nr:LysM peptidoglycan-binding domain-containing protein [Phototrophicaceae bacterium]
MRSRLGRFLILPILLLLITACTRQAEGPFQPVGDQTTSVAGAASATPESVIIETLTGTDETASTPEQAITEFVPVTSEVGVTEPSSTEDGGIAIFTLVPTETATDGGIPFDTTETATTEGGETAEVTDTGTQFITPGTSPDLMLGATQTPEPGTTDESPLLDTPTNMPEVDGGTSDAGDGTAVDENCIYTVQRGDSLFHIALANDITVAELRAANEDIQTTDVILPGQELFIPDCDVTPTATMSRTPFPEGQLTHTVKAGESLFVIAQKYGVTINAIVEANDLANPDRLAIGQVLIIPEPEP